MKNQSVENVIENTSEDSEMSFTQEALETEDVKEDFSNDLKEFGVDTNEPDLFSSSNHGSNSDNLENLLEENEEDDLEIPAFLRRQKN